MFWIFVWFFKDIITLLFHYFFLSSCTGWFALLVCFIGYRAGGTPTPYDTAFDNFLIIAPTISDATISCNTQRLSSIGTAFASCSSIPISSLSKQLNGEYPPASSTDDTINSVSRLYHGTNCQFTSSDVLS